MKILRLYALEQRALSAHESMIKLIREAYDEGYEQAMKDHWGRTQDDWNIQLRREQERIKAHKVKMGEIP